MLNLKLISYMNNILLNIQNNVKNVWHFNMPYVLFVALFFKTIKYIYKYKIYIHIHITYLLK